MLHHMAVKKMFKNFRRSCEHCIHYISRFPFRREPPSVDTGLVDSFQQLTNSFAFSFRNHEGIPFGPHALCGFRDSMSSTCSITPRTVNEKGPMVGFITEPTKGALYPRGEPTATPSICLYKFPLSLKNWFFAPILISSIRFVFLILRLRSLLNQPLVRQSQSLFAKIIVHVHMF